LRSALEGRRVIVLTIDPARRLANSLGLTELTNEPQRIDLTERVEDVDIPEGGELWAMMLDQKQTLDDLVRRYAPDKGALKRSHENNIYRLLSTALAGMQEYMALDKLHDLYTGGYFDLVVLDTPPTKNALEFLQTPGRARQFFDDRVIKWFLPNRQAKGLLGRVMNPAGSVVLSLLGRVFGKSFVEDLVDFFDTLQFLQDALRTRGEMIDFILRDPATHFVVITSADKRRIKEALFFHEKLGELDQQADAFILNRVIPNFDIDDLAEIDPSALQSILQDEGGDEDVSAQLARQLERQYAHLAKLAAHNRELIALLSGQVGPGLLRTIPLFGEDVHDIRQLRRLGHFLTPSSPI
jgi:anion-transporting  ArsA/GET3 family ATPase